MACCLMDRGPNAQIGGATADVAEHGQMLPNMAASMSASSGEGVCSSRAVADMTCPAWQYPHCGTSRSFQAATTRGPDASAETPSIVVIAASPTDPTGVWHERTGCPSSRTVQAPHSPAPQPNFVPGMCRSSRRTQSNGLSGSAETSWLDWLTLRLKAMVSPHLRAAISSPARLDKRSCQSTGIASAEFIPEGSAFITRMPFCNILSPAAG